MAKKCVICGQWIEKEEEENCTPYKNRLAHADCFKSAMKMIKTDKDEQLEEKRKQKAQNSKRKKLVQTPKSELKDGLSDEEYKEKQSYYNYLKQLLNTDKLSAKIYTLSEKYVTKYEDWTWGGMKNALVYIKEIKEEEITGDVVGLLPYIYEEAESFFNNIDKVAESNKNASLSDMYQTKHIIFRKRTQKVSEDLVIESIKHS